MNKDLKERAFDLAMHGVEWKRKLRIQYPEIGSQVVKSLTSIGANIAESERAESKKDWIHKLQISAKEAQEALFWLKLINEQIEPCQEQIDSLNYLLGTLINIIRRTRKKL